MAALRSAVGLGLIALASAHDFSANPNDVLARGNKFGTSASCSDPQTSCQNTTAVSDLCCFNAPGGSLLQVQLWDSSPSTGPSNSWTIHGLWPDNCNGGYEENCDTSRAYTNITAILQQFGDTDLLNYMNTYWLSDDESNEAFWEHEWGTHGTCINTLDPSCYTDYEPTQEVPDFFNTVVNLFKTLPTYTWLSDAGITPSSSKTYTASQIQSALSAKNGGYSVYLDCSSDQLQSIYYFYNVKGSVQTGTFVPTNVVGSSSNCPSSGIQYLPKTGNNTAIQHTPSQASVRADVTRRLKTRKM